MKSIEIEAPSREEAIKTALKILGVDRKEVIVKILREEKRGLFGKRGAKPAKVRVIIKGNTKPTIRQ
ncbi:MAG: hypothetical protein FJZ16_06800 [Candidatus Omnitrophica bacterium]|nr:hypothetical protein [Candidatus Omnitrophota bacterium]